MDRQNNDDDRTPRLHREQNTERYENALNNEVKKHGGMTDAIRMDDICLTTLQIWGTKFHRTLKGSTEASHKIQEISEQI